MNYAVCCIPVSPLRCEPFHKSEMVSQLLFGELCLIVEEAKDLWVKIRCRFDDYEGWCQEGHVIIIEEQMYKKGSGDLAADLINIVDFNGLEMMVPMGSSLALFENESICWKNNLIKFHGKVWNPASVIRSEETIREVASKFINTSYLWGGKSIFGMDCSGFSQTVYKFLNIPLLRDAYQQAMHGEIVSSLQEARCGDLAFFDNAEGKITHVGILFNSEEIIHAFVKVRIDKINVQGIVNQDNSELTHYLRVIKRYF